MVQVSRYWLVRDCRLFDWQYTKQNGGEHLKADDVEFCEDRYDDHYNHTEKLHHVWCEIEKAVMLSSGFDRKVALEIGNYFSTLFWGTDVSGTVIDVE